MYDNRYKIGFAVIDIAILWLQLQKIPDSDKKKDGTN